MDVAELYRCPACLKSRMKTVSRQLVCEECGRGYGDQGGYYDLIDRGAVGGERMPGTTEQRLMESELIARLYERFWRPAFVHMFAGGGASALTGGFGGEFFINKNSLGMDEREGPWLDLSCGPGLFARAMASTRPGDWVVGLDISRAMIEVAARRARGYDNVSLVRADAHSMPLADSSMGGVNNSGALHVYDDPEEVFREVFRVLKPSGLYVGSTFARSSSVLGRMSARLTGIRRFSPPELRAWLSAVGFADYEDIRLGDAFIFRARKP